MRHNLSLARPRRARYLHPGPVVAEWRGGRTASPLTRGLRTAEAEHDDLTTRGRIDIARKIETARELGDLSENGDYHAAKEEQGKMEGRIIHLASILENAEVVETGMHGADTVQAGCVVAIRYEGDDEPEQYLIGSIEERHDD